MIALLLSAQAPGQTDISRMLAEISTAFNILQLLPSLEKDN